MKFTEPSINFFSFNNPFGACQTCEGFGKILGIDEDLVIPDKSLSVYEGAIAPWRSETMGEWQKPLVKNGIKFDFPIHRPYNELTKEQQELLWNGNEYFDGIHTFSSTSNQKHIKFNTAYCSPVTGEELPVRTAEAHACEKMLSM